MPTMAKLHDLDVDDYLAECVNMVPEALEEEFCRLPADMAYWAERASAAARDLLVAEREKKRVGARLLLEERDRANDEKPKPTVDEIHARVELREEYIEAVDEHIEAEVEAERLKHVVHTIRAKKDMLVSIGMLTQAELRADPSIRDAREAERITGRG